MITLKNLVISTIQLVMYGFIIYYMNTLTHKNCLCKIDWRHDFIAIYSWIMIVFIVLKYYVFDNITESQAKSIEIYHSYTLIKTLIPFTDIIHIYAFFTYVTEINKSKTCSKCLSKRLKKTNEFMVHRKYIFVVVYVLTILFVIFPVNDLVHDIKHIL